MDKVVDNGADWKYWYSMPNLIDDLGLSVWAHRLYSHIKRVCGANGGTCYQGTRKMADVCKMSMGKVSEAKKELQEVGLIIVQTFPAAERKGDEIQIVDIWSKNFAVYGDATRPLNERIDNAMGLPCSPDEQPCSPDEHKNNPYKKNSALTFSIDQRLKRVARTKRARAKQYDKWHSMDADQLADELRMWQAMARKYTTRQFISDALRYLEQLASAVRA